MKGGAFSKILPILVLTVIISACPAPGGGAEFLQPMPEITLDSHSAFFSFITSNWQGGDIRLGLEPSNTVGQYQVLGNPVNGILVTNLLPETNYHITVFWNEEEYYDFFINTPEDSSTEGDGELEPDPPPVEDVIPEEYWGSWYDFDNGENFIVNGTGPDWIGAITSPNSYNFSTSNVFDQDKSKIIDSEDMNIRAMKMETANRTTLTGSLVDVVSGPGLSVKGRGISDLGSISLILKNLGRVEDNAAINLDSVSGDITISDAELQTDYEITPVEDAGTADEVIYPSTTIRPTSEGQEFGAVFVTDQEYLFKSSILIDGGYAYGDGLYYNVTVKIENQGSEVSPATLVNISSPTLVLSESTDILPTIQAGESESFTFAVSYTGMSTQRELHQIDVEIPDSIAGNWTETLSIPLYRDYFFLYIFESDPDNSIRLNVSDFDILDSSGEFRQLDRGFAYSYNPNKDEGGIYDGFPDNAYTQRLPEDLEYSIFVKPGGEEYAYGIFYSKRTIDIESESVDLQAVLLGEEAAGDPDNTLATARAIQMDEIFYGYSETGDLDIYELDGTNMTPALVPEAVYADQYSSHILFSNGDLYSAGNSVPSSFQGQYFSPFNPGFFLSQSGVEAFLRAGRFIFLEKDAGEEEYFFSYDSYYSEDYFADVSNVVQWVSDYSSSNDNEKRLLYRDTDGNIYGKGHNGSGQLGTGNRLDLTEFQLLFSSAVSMAASDEGTYIVDSDGKAYSAGRLSGDGTSSGENLIFTEIGSGMIKVVSHSESSVLFLSESGTVYALGGNNYGELGIDESVDTYTLQIIPGLSGIQDIAASFDSFYFLDNEENLYVLGTNHYGQLGLGSLEDWITSPTLSAEDIADFDINRDHGIILKNDGTVWTTGRNSNTGVLGTGSMESEERSWVKVWPRN